MYANLMKEMKRRKLTIEDLADMTGLSEKEFSQKFSGKYSFTVAEALHIQQALNTEMTIETLFSKTV